MTYDVQHTDSGDEAYATTFEDALGAAATLLTDYGYGEAHVTRDGRWLATARLVADRVVITSTQGRRG